MEANNAQAMREALKTLLNLAYEVQDANSECGPKTSVPAQFVIDVAKSALSEPARNCDVGTAGEQAERYGRYCDKFTRDGMHCETCPCCGKIPFGKCEFAWVQMPYESEEAEDEMLG